MERDNILHLTMERKHAHTCLKQPTLNLQVYLMREYSAIVESSAKKQAYSIFQKMPS